VLGYCPIARIEHQPPKLGVEGSNPSPPATNLKTELNSGFLIPMIDSQFWVSFKGVLAKDYRGDWKNQIFNNAQKYSQYLVRGDLSFLKTFPDGKRLNTMKALSAYAKFSGCYERYKRLIKEFGLKWSINNDDVIIARLIKYESTPGTANDLFQWIENVKRKIPALNVFMDFVVATGLRFDEAINSYKLIVDLSRKGKLGEYYNSERSVLEHFRFKEIFIRRTKKTFMSFVSKELINSVQSSGLDITQDVVRMRMQRLGIPMRFSDLREYFASCSVKHLKQPEIDFLQGRVSTSVFMQNYFNPMWITDLKKRAIENIHDLLEMTVNLSLSNN
jgi:hypothetical protein